MLDSLELAQVVARGVNLVQRQRLWVWPSSEDDTETGNKRGVTRLLQRQRPPGASEARGRAAWAHTASLLAMLANVNRDPKRTRPFQPADFDPYGQIDRNKGLARTNRADEAAKTDKALIREYLTAHAGKEHKP